MSRVIKYVQELEQRYTTLENKCKTQETVIERLNKNYHELKKNYDKAMELIDVAAKCMDDCDYAMTKVSNYRVEEAVSEWNDAYSHFKAKEENDEI